MALQDTIKINKLAKLKAQLSDRAGLEAFNKSIDNINLNNISLTDLKSLVIPRYAQGLDWSSLDLSTMDSHTMNQVAPGSIDVRELKQKLANISLVRGRTTDLVDTQSGVMAVVSEVRINGDVEDVIKSKCISQGTNLQMTNRATQINADGVAEKAIKSNFINSPQESS